MAWSTLLLVVCRSARLRALIPYVRFVSKPNLIGYQWYTRGPTRQLRIFRSRQRPRVSRAIHRNAFAHLADEHPRFRTRAPHPPTKPVQPNSGISLERLRKLHRGCVTASYSRRTLRQRPLVARGRLFRTIHDGAGGCATATSATHFHALRCGEGAIHDTLRGIPSWDVDLDKVAQIIREFGLGGAVLIIFAIGIAFNLSNIAREARLCIDAILAYRLASKRIKEEIRKDKQATQAAIEAAKQLVGSIVTYNLRFYWFSLFLQLQCM